MYEFTGFFARPAVPRPLALPPGADWREIDTPFVGVGVRLPGSDDRLLTPSEAEALAGQLGLDAAGCWVFLTYDTTPGYLDTFALPTTPTKWKYRGRYRVGEDPIGLWSAEVSLTVGG